MGERAAGNLELVGGSLCLDYANTVSTRTEGLCREYLTSYDELVEWSHHVGILTSEEASVLRNNAACHPDQATATLSRAVAVRETLYRVFSSIAHDQEPYTADLATLNRVLREGLSRMEISPDGPGFAWTWVVDKEELDRILWPILRSAADLLTSEDLRRVQQCARDGCDWLFLDLSKNQSRRWCSMDTCGSRVKSRRYYRRRKHRERTG
ncbi:MAG TPA: ABATE domain-containing protein [Anaerolineae bacterium]|nr:ABATE domain-containing protein [Anaerolineae bacterium]